MKLERVRIRNYRCFGREAAVDLDEITALVGKNDSGKSSILEALDMFLNDGTPDADDACKHGDRRDLVVICEFGRLPDEVVVDDEFPTSLQKEHLLNSGGRLEIHKTYSGHLRDPKCASVEAFALHPTVNGAADLLQLKNPDLKRRAEELGVDLAGVDLRVNAQIRERIRESFEDLELAETPIPLNDENAHKVWTELKKYLPAFALFKSDRASTDQDPEAQDPLKAAVKEAIKAKEEELAGIADFVKGEVQKIAALTLEKLREMDPSLATELTPSFSQLKWDSLFKASITSDGDIPMNKRGSGVKRLVLLNFFRAKAEDLARKDSRTSIIYAIEEPETSQHPNNQRMLLRALSDLSSEAQVIVSTHTPMLARGLPDTCLRYVGVNEDGSREIVEGGAEANELFARSLGVLPDNSVKLFIGVEGPNDIAFLQGMATALRADGVKVPDLEGLDLDGEVVFFPLGGSTLALWVSRLEPLCRPEFHLFDRDTVPPEPPRYQAAIDQVNARERCKARSTHRREIENYIHVDTIVAAYADNGVEITIPANYGPYDDVPQKVARLVHEASESPKAWDELTQETVEEKERKAKRVLCSRAVRLMTKARLDEVDTDGDLLEWFNDIAELLVT